MSHSQRKKRDGRLVWCFCGAGPFASSDLSKHKRRVHSKAARFVSALAVAVLAGCSAPPVLPAATPLPPTTTSTTMAPVTTTTAVPPSIAVVVSHPTWVEPLAACESTWDIDGKPPHRINPKAISRTGRYRNAFQFSFATWRSVGGKGDPVAAAWPEQIARAVRLHAEEDPYKQWPTCWPLLYGRRHRTAAAVLTTTTSTTTTTILIEPDAPPVADVSVCDDPEVDCGG